MQRFQKRAAPGTQAARRACSGAKTPRQGRQGQRPKAQQTQKMQKAYGGRTRHRRAMAGRGQGQIQLQTQRCKCQPAERVPGYFSRSVTRMRSSAREGRAARWSKGCTLLPTDFRMRFT